MWGVLTSMSGLITIVNIGVVSSPLMAALSPLWRTLSPSDLQEATVIEAPLTEVTVYRDHAAALREGLFQAKPEGALLRLPDLPHQAREVRISARSAEVLRIVQTQRFRSDLDLKTLKGHVESLEEISHRTAELSARLRAPTEELSLLTSLSPKLGALKAERLNLSPRWHTVWRSYLELAATRQLKAQQESAKLTKSLKAQLKRGQDHINAVRVLVQRARQRQVLQVYALIASERPLETSVSVNYRLPNAYWRPIYELHVDVNKSRLQRSFGVSVKQESGEDWSQIKLKVSTGDDKTLLTRPKIQSWLLGEEQQFKPRIIAARSSNPPPTFQAPVLKTRADEEGQSGARSLELRLQNAQSQIHLITRELPTLGGLERSFGGAINFTVQEERSELPSAMLDATSPAAPSVILGAPSPAPSSRGEGGGHRYREGAQAARAPKLGSASPPRASVASDSVMVTSMSPRSDNSRPHNTQRRRAGSSRARGGLSLSDQVQYLPDHSPYRYRFIAPNPATILNGAEAITVPMTVHREEIRLVYESTPALSPHAYLTGEAIHRGQSPILAGRASLFSGGSFIGVTELPTVLQGGEFTLHLGADPDLKVKRQLEIESETSGVFSRTETHTYTVRLHVVNHKQRAVQIKLYDVLPMSDHEEVEVKLISSRPSVVIEDKKVNVVSWELSLKAGEKREVTLRYQISHPAGQKVYQR